MISTSSSALPRISRISRIGTVGGLSTAALAVAVFTMWGIYIHSTWEFRWGHSTPDRASQSFLGRGLRILTQHEHFTLGAALAIAGVLAAVALVVLMLRGLRWPLLVTSIGALVAIVPGWIVRSQVWETEAKISRSAKWAARSQYVTNATTITIAVTCFLALLAVVAFVAWLTNARRRT